MGNIKVFYDYQIMLAQKYGGISRYFYELILRLNNIDTVRADTFCIGNKNAYFKSYFNKISNKHIRGLGVINRFVTSKKIKNYDIVHPTYYNPYLLKRKHGRIVITVYDMIHELFSDMFPEGDKTSGDKKKMIYGADHIIAISQSTKNDILKLYPDISPDKITVIYIGSNMIKKVDKTDFDLPEKFILFVGNRGLYKNFTKFFNGIKPILIKDAEMNLVCLGGGAFNDEEKDLISEVATQVKQRNAYDEELAYAYSKAKCFVFPSLYEGFGIPTLEAFNCDCPVLLSNTSSMPEVGGDAAVYFDPYDEQDIYNKVTRVLSDEQLQTNMILKGREQLKIFDWDKIAQETVDCYKKVLNSEVNQ